MKTRFAILLAVSALATACAGMGPSRSEVAGQKYVQYAGDPVDRFTAFDIDGWTSVDRTHVVIWARQNEAYLLTVWDTCTDLAFANVIRLNQTGASVTKFDYLQVGRDRCQITEIRPIDIRKKKADERAAADAARAAKAESRTVMGRLAIISCHRRRPPCCAGANLLLK